MNKLILTKENDPRCLEYYNKAFPELSENEKKRKQQHWKDYWKEYNAENNLK